MIQSNYPQGYIGNVQPVLTSQQQEEGREFQKASDIGNFISSKQSEGYTLSGDTLTKDTSEGRQVITINKDSGTYSVTDFKNVQVSTSAPTSEYGRIESEIHKTEQALKSASGKSYDAIQNRLEQLYQARDDLSNTGNANTTYLTTKQEATPTMTYNINTPSKVTASDLVNTNLPQLNFNAKVSEAMVNSPSSSFNPSMFTVSRTISPQETSTISQPIQMNIPQAKSYGGEMTSFKASDYGAVHNVDALSNFEFKYVTEPSYKLAQAASVPLATVAYVVPNIFVGGIKEATEIGYHPEKIPEIVGTGLLIGATGTLGLVLASSYATADILTSGSVSEGSQKVGALTFDVGVYGASEGIVKASPKFTSTDVLRGTIRESPSIVSSQVRAGEFIKNEGITENTFDTLNRPLSQVSVLKSRESITGSYYEKPIEVSFGNYPRRVESVTILDFSKPSGTGTIIREMPSRMNLIEVPSHPYESNTLFISEAFAREVNPSPEQISLYTPNQLGYRNLIEMESNLNVRGSSTISGGAQSYNAIASYRPSLYEFGAVTIEQVPTVAKPVYKGSSKPFTPFKSEVVKENVVDNSAFFNFEPQESITVGESSSFNVLGGGRVNLGNTRLIFEEPMSVPSESTRLELYGDKSIRNSGSEPLTINTPIVSLSQGFNSIVTTASTLGSQVKNILDVIPSSKSDLNVTPKSTTIQSQSPFQIQEQGMAQVQILSQVQEQSLQQVQVQSLRQESKQEQRTKVEEPYSFDNRLPQEPKFKLTASMSPNKKKQSFKTEVRKRGVFRLIGSASDIGEAISLGESDVVGTASASFRIKNEQGSIVDIQTPKGYERSKRERGVIIQPRSKRIGSFGEKQEITFKGIQANRLKGSITKGFNGGGLI